jgi:hypothetical protein
MRQLPLGQVPLAADGLASQRTQVAPGPWFGDGGHVFRPGFAYEPVDRLEKDLDLPLC